MDRIARFEGAWDVRRRNVERCFRAREESSPVGVHHSGVPVDPGKACSVQQYPRFSALCREVFLQRSEESAGVGARGGQRRIGIFVRVYGRRGGERRRRGGGRRDCSQYPAGPVHSARGRDLGANVHVEGGLHPTENRGRSYHSAVATRAQQGLENGHPSVQGDDAIGQPGAA